jgi:hypothetical protein
MIGLCIGNLRKKQSGHGYQGNTMLHQGESQTSLYEKGGRSNAYRVIVYDEGDRLKMKIDNDSVTGS